MSLGFAIFLLDALSPISSGFRECPQRWVVVLVRRILKSAMETLLLLPPSLLPPEALFHVPTSVINAVQPGYTCSQAVTLYPLSVPCLGDG